MRFIAHWILDWKWNQETAYLILGFYIYRYKCWQTENCWIIIIIVVVAMFDFYNELRKKKSLVINGVGLTLIFTDTSPKSKK